MKKNIIFTLFCLLFLFIKCDVYAAVDCNKYACATCIYTSGNGTIQYVYDIKSNGDGTLSVDFSPKFNGNVQGIGGVKSNVQNAYFINSTTNKIECYPIYTQSNGGRAPVFTAFSENATGRTKLDLSSSSTNNNKTLTSSESNTKLCTFKDTVTTKTNTTCNVTISDNKLVSVDCGNRTYNSVKSDVSGVDFSKDCSQIKLYMYCDVNQPYCTLNKNAHFGDTTQGSDTQTGDEVNKPEFSCKYTGQLSGNYLTIDKYEKNWEIKYATNNTKIVPVDKVGANIFPTKNCEDIFYLSNLFDSIKAVGVDGNKFIKENIAGYCRGYGNDVEQFCANNICKVSNPLCGGNSDKGDKDYGTCPQELVPIVYFVKKIAFNTLRIFVPIILILMGTIDLTKAVMANDDKLMKDSTNKFIRRILTAIILFFIVTIVTIVMDMFATSGVGKNDGWKACWYNVD